MVYYSMQYLISIHMLSIFCATASQTIESRKRSYESWGRGLSLEQYFERDVGIEQHDVGRDGKLTTWVLAPIDNPETLDFPCSCETYVLSSSQS